VDFDDQLRRYFGTADFAGVAPEALAAGIERMRVDLGLEKDRGRRFALWAVLHMFGEAPDLDIAFPDAEDRDAARTFMDLAEVDPHPLEAGGERRRRNGGTIGGAEIAPQLIVEIHHRALSHAGRGRKQPAPVSDREFTCGTPCAF
jgi:hypothetical protein